MKPLKITAKLFDGRIATTDGYLPFDSILAAAWIKKYHPEKYYNSDPSIDAEIIKPELPLKKLDGDIYATSFAQFRKAGEETAYWHKRFDAQLAEDYVDFAGRRGRINTTSATYKAYRMPLNIILTPEIVWYVVGGKEEIESLLDEIPSLGKKTSQGFGQVTEWVVEKVKQDWSIWKNGILMRNIPDQDGDSEWGVRPPYWYQLNVVRCRMP
ncbi:MAG: hypothetical protein WA125_17485 [Desulfosporosinus sp.]